MTHAHGVRTVVLSILAGVAVSASADSVAGEQSKLHIPQGRRVSFTHYMTDGGGFRWDIQYYGTVGSGTNSAFSGGMYLQIGGSNVRSSGYGWLNAAGDELEIGPYTRSNLKCYRRIKIYRKRPLARWMEILENPTGQDIKVQARVYSNMSYTIRDRRTSSGKGEFGPKDWGFATQTARASVMQVVCSRRSKVRPTVQISGNTAYVYYNIVVPAHKTVVLCHFASQANNVADHVKALKAFRSRTLLADLSPAVRKLIVNFADATGMEISLDRSETSDTVMLASGDPIYGKITNARYAVRTFFGDLTLEAKDVLGMAGAGESLTQVRFVLASGQIISGQSSAKLNVALPAGGKLDIPLADVRQWSYQVSDARPVEDEIGYPFVELRTGDRLTFDPAGLKLPLRTRHGAVALDPESLLEVRLVNPGNVVHRAVFLNGSRLAGLVETDVLNLKLALGREVAIPRHKIIRVRFAAVEKPTEGLSDITLRNGDELLARILAKKITLITPYNAIDLVADTVKSIRVTDKLTAVEMWDGTIHKGRLGADSLELRITPGPTLRVHPAQVVTISRPDPQPPEALQKQVADLIKQLSAESYKDRQEATEKLKGIRGIRSLLGKYRKHEDPEVRERIEEVLRSSVGADAGARPGNPALRQIMLQRQGWGG